MKIEAFLRSIFLSIRSLKDNKGFMRYFNNTSWLIIEKCIRIIEAFVIGIWVARYLGPQEFGILSYSLSFVFLFTAFAALGLDQIVVRELVKDHNKRDVILGTTLGLKFIGFLFMLILLITSLQFTNNSKITNVIILIIAISIFFKSFNGIDLYFQSKIQSKYIAITNIIVILICGIIKAILIFNAAELINFAYVFIVETFLLSSGYILCYKYNKQLIQKWQFKFTVAKELLSKSWPLIIGGVAAAIYMKIDQVMIKEIMNERSVGLYSAADKLCSVWLIITVAITQSVFPFMVESRKIDRNLFLNKLQKLYDVLIKVAISASLIYTFFANKIMVFLFGIDYIDASEILIVYIWSSVFVFLSNGSWCYYLNENLEKFASIRLVIGAVLNIILNLYFITVYGLLGAAYATLISYSISGYFVNLLFSKTRDNFYLQTRSLFNFFNFKTWIKPL